MYQNSKEETTRLVNRMARIIGHANKVKRMIAEGADTADVLTQLAAVRAALTSTSKLIIEGHVADSMERMSGMESEEERQETLAGIMDIMNQFIK